MSEKHSLQNNDIIIAYRGAGQDRQENLYAVLRHLDATYTDYKILLFEADAKPTFDWNVLSDPKIHHVFMPHDGKFPKALLYNTAAKMSTSQILIFHDADCITDPNSFAPAVNELIHFQAHDVLCPYHEMIDVTGGLKNTFMNNPRYEVFTGINRNALAPDTRILYQRNTGGVFVFRRKDFVKVGGLNTEFVGWGGEDSELFFRATRLGLGWSSFGTPLFHLNHDSQNRFEWGVVTDEGKENGRVAALSETMPIEELQALSDRLKTFFD